MARFPSGKILFNPSIKEEFLESLNSDETAKIYRYAFYRSYPTESTLNRDLYTFSTDEIKDALEAANHTTMPSIRLTYNVFKSYLDWSAKYSNSNINIMENIRTDELKNFLSTSRILFSFEEIIEMQSELLNYQDKVVLRAIYEGVYGYEGSELLNLTKFDIENNTLKLKDDKYGRREIEVSDELINIMHRALDETEYINKNGLTEGRWKHSTLLTNDFVIKTALKYKTKEYGRGQRSILYNRIKMMKDYFDNSHITPNNIKKSGMLKLAKDLYEKNGKLDNVELAEIAKKFGVRSIVNNGYEVYNYSILREYINKENLEEIYGLKIK